MTHSLLESPLLSVAALGLALSASAGCSAFDGQPLTSSDYTEVEAQATPAAGPPVSRIGQVQLPVEPSTSHPSNSLEARTESTSDVLGHEQAALVGDRMSFQTQLVDRMQKLDQRVATVRNKLASADAQTGADVNALLTSFAEARKDCEKAQDGLVVAPNEAWSDTKADLVAKLDGLTGYVARMEAQLGIGNDLL